MRTDIIAAQESPGAGRSGSLPLRPDQVEERSLTFGGFRYTCRIVHQSVPETVPLLLLGGSSQNRYAWVRHEKWLAPLCSLITVDLPGYGESDFLPERYGIDFLAATVRHMLTEIRVPEVNLLGACFGGAIALRFAQHYPQYVKRLALGGVTMTIPDDYAESVPRWLRMLERGEMAQSAEALVAKFMAPPGAGHVRKQAAVARLLYRQFMSQTPEELRMMAEHNTRLLRHEWYRAEPVPAVPTLVFTGEHDVLTTPEMGREVAASLPAAQFLTIKESDHLVHVERMAEFADMMGRFCTGRPTDDLPYCTPAEFLGTAPATVPGCR
ncbi:alpha/beta fold hydrolase [Streptomyces sp. KR80]|uniref:alpha/beta fold hydrolase n=1 Tax=Streptomyces sp. KR80 TaxID=3457426 RepID=UPI003FD28821